MSDYYRIAPRYGTNADMRRLFAKASKLGIRILLDLVPGHTSNQHSWFVQSCRAQKNKFTNWFVWTDSVWGSASPMGSVSGYAERDAQYVTNFFWFQPALNYGFAKPDPGKKWQLPTKHPDVLALKREMKNVIRFWLDMGAAGYRVDMAASLVKNDDAKKTATSAFWRDIRKMLDREYPEAVLISEWGEPDLSLNAGFHMDFMLHFGPPAYNSLFRSGDKSFFSPAGKGDITLFTDYYAKIMSKAAGRGHICIPSGNHDMERIAELGGEETLRTVFVFLLTMPGVPFIYYGDEIGMRHQKQLVSKEGGYGRTGARTPMQWDSRRKNCGFSRGKESSLYLPVDKSRGAPSVAGQENNQESLLNFVRRLSGIRRDNPVLGAKALFKPLFAEKGRYPFIYMRSLGASKAVVALNPSSEACSASFAKLGNLEPLVAQGVEAENGGSRTSLRMGPTSYAVFLVR